MKKLNKCKSIFQAFNDIQFKYGDVLDNNNDIVEIECNVDIKECDLGVGFTSDFYCLKSDGSYMVRECVYKDRLLKLMTISMLDASRNFAFTFNYIRCTINLKKRGD